MPGSSTPTAPSLTPIRMNAKNEMLIVKRRVCVILRCIYPDFCVVSVVSTLYYYSYHLLMSRLLKSHPLAHVGSQASLFCKKMVRFLCAFSAQKPHHFFTRASAAGAERLTAYGLMLHTVLMSAISYKS